MNITNLLNGIALYAETQGEGSDTLKKSFDPVLKKFYEVGGIIIPVIIGVVALLIIIKLILLGMKLAQSGDDPEERSRIIKGMIWWGVGLVIAVAACASIAVVFNILNDNMELPTELAGSSGTTGDGANTGGAPQTF